MDEILDIVNEQDEVVGQAPRQEANHNPAIIHREIGILLVDPENRVLLQQRSKEKTNPGLWILNVAGHVTSGLTYEQAAHKELQEELGFDTELTLFSKELIRLASESVFVALFEGHYNNQEIKLDPHEVEAVRFFTQEEFEAFFAKDNQVEPHSAATIRAYWNRNL